MPDLAIIGAGPIGLWAALQVKDQMPEVNITFLEKHEIYKRTHHVRVKSSSLPEVSQDSNIYDIVQFLKTNQNPRTSDFERMLANKALALDIKIIRKCPLKSREDLAQHVPNATLIVPADGAHSAARRLVFGENDLSENHDLHYIAELKADVKGNAKAVKLFDKFRLNIETGTFNKLYLGTYDKVSNTTPVTIRTFIPKKSFDKLSGWTTFDETKSLQELKEREPAVHEHFAKWIKKEKLEIVEGSSKISVTKLGSYRAPKAVVEQTWGKVKRIFAFVGDAFLGVPFFQSMNNGLRSGTKLASCIVRHFKGDHAALGEYETYVNRLARWEILASRVKSFFVKSYIFLMSSQWKMLQIIAWLGLSRFKSADFLDEVSGKLFI